MIKKTMVKVDIEKAKEIAGKIFDSLTISRSTKKMVTRESFIEEHYQEYIWREEDLIELTEDDFKEEINWLQGDETPSCCGKKMIFVNSFTEPDLCKNPPDGCKIWWHDYAEFYVFTCDQCLSVKAIGQQF